MADAIIKVSWRRLADGRVVEGRSAAAGGIAGTCFTLSSGMTLSCAHGHGNALFEPNVGFDDCKVWIVERSGRITELKNEQFRLYPEYDAAIISDFSSQTKYGISTKAASALTACNLLGYQASTGPFHVRTSPNQLALEIYDPHIADAEQTFNGLTPVPIRLNIHAADVTLSDKAGYIFDVRAKIGLSGGPMIDAADGSAVGVCSFGLPADVVDKTQIGVVDLRQFPFI